MTKQVPFFDLSRQTAAIRDELDAAIAAVIGSSSFIGGKAVAKFEENAARYTGFKHAIAVSSGTDALLVSLMATGALEYVQNVMVPAYSFFATVGAPLRLDADINFCDIGEDFVIDPDRLRLNWGEHLIPVQLFGRPVNPAIYTEAKRHHYTVIDDAAQAFGAIRGDGPHGDLTCFSFFPAKVLGCFGDGGMVATNDDALAKEVRLLRNHGAEPKYYHARVGGNFRLDAIQAAILSVKLRHLAEWIALRKQHAQFYDSLLEPAFTICPPPQEVYAQYVIRAHRRDDLRKFLADHGIGTEIYYPVPLHKQECVSMVHSRQSLPGAENAAEDSLALPIFPELRRDELRYVADMINKFYEIGVDDAG